jgi:hypothetical protein
MSTFSQRFFSYLCCCCPGCQRKSLAQQQVTGGDEDWGLNYDDQGQVRVSKEVEPKPLEIERTEPSVQLETDDTTQLRESNGTGVVSGSPKLMKASSADLVVRGNDGWSKYKATNLNTEEAEDLDETSEHDRISLSVER